MEIVKIPEMIIWLAGVFTPLLTAGIGWLIKNSIALSERVAVIDSKLTSYATLSHVQELETSLRVLEQRVGSLEKK